MFTFKNSRNSNNNNNNNNYNKIIFLPSTFDASYKKSFMQKDEKTISDKKWRLWLSIKSDLFAGKTSLEISVWMARCTELSKKALYSIVVYADQQRLIYAVVCGSQITRRLMPPSRIKGLNIFFGRHGIFDKEKYRGYIYREFMIMMLFQ